MTCVTTTKPAASSDQISWLVDQYGPTLYRIAFTIVRDRQLAEDVIQEVLIKAWTSMPSWDDDVPIRWARTVTKNAALSAIRYSSARPADRLDPTDTALPTNEAAEDEVVRNDDVAAMWAALGSLDEASRMLIVLHEVDGLSYEEIALTADMTLSAVKSKLFRARSTLRKEVSR